MRAMLIVACAAGVAAACGAPPKPVEPRFVEVAVINKAKCGTCHKRIEPGQRTRARLELAFIKHKKRVPMTDANWALMIDYLAADGGSAPPAMPPPPG